MIGKLVILGVVLAVLFGGACVAVAVDLHFDWNSDDVDDSKDTDPGDDEDTGIKGTELIGERDGKRYYLTNCTGDLQDRFKVISAYGGTIIEYESYTWHPFGWMIYWSTEVE